MISTTTLFTILSIAAGGALGAVARYSVNLLSFQVLGQDFPYGTLLVNIIGSFIMGLLIATFAHFWQPPKYINFLLVTGFLGAFTTFSTFSLDVATLFERGAYLATAGYMAGSVFLSIAALFGAMALVRAFA